MTVTEGNKKGSSAIQFEMGAVLVSNWLQRFSGCGLLSEKEAIASSTHAMVYISRNYQSDKI